MISVYKEILINNEESIKAAMKQLDKIADKILFVVDKDFKLIGSLTDGDIRRWILKDGDLNAKTEDVCYKGTYCVNENFDLGLVKEEILKRMILYVPIVNENKIIKEFIIWDKITDGKVIRKPTEKLNADVVVMAGGKGTRLEPFTRILPKPLIPIGDKTIIELILDKFYDYGVNDFYVSVNHKAKIIKSYFEEVEPNYTINYLYEKKPLGTIGAIKQLEGKTKENIVIVNCDVIIETNYVDLLKHHKENKNDITIVASLKHYNIPYGICEIESGGKLISIKEKPEYDLLVNTGMYVLRTEVIKHIPKNEYYNITDLIESIKKTSKVGVYPISENSWIDTGEWVEYKKAVEKIKL